MRNTLRSRSRPARWWRPWTERLEDRTLFAVQAVPLPFTPSQTAHAAGRLAAANDFDLYSVRLGTGDTVSAAVAAQATGSSLQSVLRVFDATGHQVALDDQEGGDPRLTFQAPAAGDYLVGISSAGDDAYDPTAVGSGQGGTTTGRYALDLRLTTGTALTADLAGSSFRLATTTAAYGDTISGTGTVENRGGADAGAFDVQVLLSASNTFAPSSSLVLQDVSLPGLAAGQAFSSGPVTVTLPDAATAEAAGLPSSGPVYLGLLIDPAAAVPELNPFDQGGVHRGADWETLTVVTPVPPGGTDLSQADPSLDTRADGTLLTPGQRDTYTFTVSADQGSGRLTAEVTPTAGTLTPRLTLAEPNGTVLVQSDDGKIVQHLQPGSYALAVSARFGAGGYRLTSEFVEASPPSDPVGAGTRPDSVAVADVNGDGKPDLISANNGDYSVSVLLGNGDGTFYPQEICAVGINPFSVAVADVNGDGIPDLIAANYGSNTVSVLLGNGDGTFQTQRTFSVGSGPRSVAVADVNGDGKPDLAVANGAGSIVGVLLGNGDGTFQDQQTLAVGSEPLAVAVADVNGDGKPDLAVANYHGLSVSVLLGHGDGTFTPATPTSGAPLRNTPILADLTGDGIPDSVVLDGSGNILFRKGLSGSGEQFAPPVILNPGRPARDLALVNTPAGPAIAAADTHADPTLATPANPFVYTVSLYTVAPDGTPTRITAFSTPFVPTRLAAGDLTGNGRDDLVVADSLDNRVQVAFQQPDGTFSAPLTLTTGEAPSDISLTDVNGDGLLDLVVTDQASGDVTVFLNDPSHTFATSYRLRAGAGPYGLDPTTATPAVSSLDEPVSLAAGDFTGDGRNDLVVLNRGSDSFSVLPNDGSGGFGDPQAALTTSTSDGLAINAQAGPLVAGYFNGPNQPLDLAVLMPDRNQVWIYTGDGHGHFTHTFSVDAGTSPTGLSVVPGSGPGLYDLLVGDQFGDILRLVGDGKGDFQPPPPLTGDHTSLDVQTLRSDGTPEVLVADQKANLVTVQAPIGGTAFVPVVTLADGTQSTLAPGAVQWAKLDKGSPYYDAVVVASGANAILVYRGTGFDAAGNPTFAPPVSYAVGTDPVSVTIQDVSGDGIPDMLAADQGSNDIAELFGSYDANGDWVAKPGPRLKSGGSGPVAVSVRDVNGNGIPDLVVTNGQSGTFTVLPGVGQGFFNDQNPQVLNVPGNPVLEAPSFFGTSGQGVAATADGRLIGFDLGNFAASVGTVFAPPAGEGVAAAEALANGFVVAALDGGTVVELAPSNGGLAVDGALQSLTGIPSDPSALAVLQGESGLQVLVTNAGGDRVFVFGIPGLPESPALPPAEAPAGPTVEVTPPVEGSLTLVVTLIAGPLPAGGVAVADVPQAGDVAVADVPQAGAVAAPAPPADPAGGGGAEGAEQVAAAPGDGSPRPGEGGIDVPEQLQGIDLYQPTPNPDRPGAISRRPDGPSRRDGVMIALALDSVPRPVAAAVTAQPPADPQPAESWAAPAEVVRAVGTDPAVRAPTAAGKATDAVFVRPPSAWDAERSRQLALALAGLAWCAGSDCLPDPERQGAEVSARRRSRHIRTILAGD